MKILSSLLLALLLFSSLIASAEQFPPLSGKKLPPENLWSVWGGSVKIEFTNTILKDFGVSAVGDFVSDSHYTTANFSLLPQSSLQFWAPGGAFDGFYAGSIRVDGGFYLRGERGDELDLRNLSIVSARDNVSLAIQNSSGEILFYLDHIHILPNPEKGSIELKNMDMRLSKLAAKRLGIPEAVNLVLGAAHMSSTLDFSSASLVKGVGCSAPQWPNGTTQLADVALIDIPFVQQFVKTASQAGVVPSARLRNVGTADVAWYAKFATGVGGTYPPPYNRDQHPLLAWNMYRLANGRMEQMGASGLKHAFLTVNVECGCASGNVLWSANNAPNGVGCTDTYGTGTNNSPSTIGIREELVTETASWEQCGSIFAPNGTAPGPCAQERGSIPFAELERRLYVNDSELNTAGAEFYFTAWYVVKDDINIFNTMGFRKILPNFVGGNWLFSFDGGFSQGSATDQWIDPNNLGAMQASDLSNTNKGQVQLMSQVEDLGAGLYRYTYGLMNYDYSTGLSQLSIPYGGGLQSSDYDDGDHDGKNDWLLTTNANSLDWAGPQVSDIHPWYMLASIAMEIQMAPVANQTITVTDADGLTLSFQGWVPGLAETMFVDGFEGL